MPMSENAITKRERDCIMCIQEGGKDGFPTRLIDIASMLHLKSPTVIAVLDRLKEKGFIRKEKGMVVLTDRGREEYRQIANNHRILETLFYDAGVSLEDACKEISNYDYMMDPKELKKLSKFIGSPTKCPHGKPIPGSESND
jgi:DtxR family Mn-dependent transcriptional regulator